MKILSVIFQVFSQGSIGMGMGTCLVKNCLSLKMNGADVVCLLSEDVRLNRQADVYTQQALYLVFIRLIFYTYCSSCEVS